MAGRFYNACMTLDASEIRALTFDDVVGMPEICTEALGILNKEPGMAPRWKVLAVILRMGDLSSIVKFLADREIDEEKTKYLNSNTSEPSPQPFDSL